MLAYLATCRITTSTLGFHSDSSFRYSSSPSGSESGTEGNESLSPSLCLVSRLSGIESELEVGPVESGEKLEWGWVGLAVGFEFGNHGKANGIGIDIGIDMGIIQPEPGWGYPKGIIIDIGIGICPGITIEIGRPLYPPTEGSGVGVVCVCACLVIGVGRFACSCILGVVRA